MFNVGDRVIVTDYSNKSYFGLRGFIISIDDNPYPILVDLGHLGTHVFNQEQLFLDK